MSNLTYAPEGYAYYSVIGTNCFNVEYLLPTDEDRYSKGDQRKMRKLERAAEEIGTSIRRSGYALL